MYKNIYDYILLSREVRKAHLKLDEPCLEIGGDSTMFKGLLAHSLKTTVPERQNKMKVLLCHGCNNGRCSNSNHLYWGTISDNAVDAQEFGKKSIRQATIEKHGTAKAQRLFKKACSKGGKANAGMLKLSEEKIAEYKQAINEADPSKWGWVSRAAKMLNVSHTQIRRVIVRYKIEI